MQRQPSPTIALAPQYRAAVRAEVLTDVGAEWASEDVPTALAVFADALAGGDELPMPLSREAQHATAQAMAFAVEHAAQAGDWQTVAGVSDAIARMTAAYDFAPPLL
jgi:hypothetical protein